ncbi:MAG TPA: hypothetical protein VH208_09630 [Myxococcaceae bacterium]|nr:hypothetical protein [Myxococcaceae bacterium]
MAQVTIYLPDPVAREVKAAARRARKSLSAYVTERLKPRSERRPAWPKDFVAVLGTWEGAFPKLEDPPPGEVDPL